MKNAYLMKPLSSWVRIPYSLYVPVEFAFGDCKIIGDTLLLDNPTFYSDFDNGLLNSYLARIDRGDLERVSQFLLDDEMYDAIKKEGPRFFESRKNLFDAFKPRKLTRPFTFPPI